MIEKEAFRIRMDNIEQMDYVINQIYSDIRYISDLEAGPARVDENGGKFTWYKATIFIRITEYG